MINREDRNMKNPLEDIKYRLSIGEIDAQLALQEVARYMTGKYAKQAEALVTEILGMPSEPKAMTASERKAAKNWEKNYRAE